MKARRLAAFLPLAAWAYLAVGRGRFWSTEASLPPGAAPPEDHRWPALAVVVPARNESELLPLTLPRLLQQRYPGPLHVVVVDDRSQDGTAEVAQSLGPRAARPVAHEAAEPVDRQADSIEDEAQARLSVVRGRPLPPGWAGKPWAMAQGVGTALAGQPSPEWVLFTDADILHPPGSLARLVWAGQGGGRQVVSVMSRLAAEGRWEKVLMPAFVYFFAQIYPFSWVNDRSRRTAAAAGGCLLVRTDKLRAAGGVEAIADRVIDDVALAQALGRAGADLWLGLAGGPPGPGQVPAVESLRRYPELKDVWDMVARSAYTQLRHNPVLLAGALAGLTTLYLAPPALALAGLAGRRPLPAAAGLGGWTVMAATYLPIVRYHRASPATAAALPLVAGLYMAMTVSSARRHRRGGAPWRAATAHLA